MKRLFSLFIAIMVTATLLSSCNNEPNLPEDSQDSSESSEESPSGDESENMLSNGDFSDGTSGWDVYLETGTGALSVVDGMLEVDISNAGSVNYAIQLFQEGFELIEGGVYKLSFDAYASVDRTFEARIQLNGGDYRAYGSLLGDLTSESTLYELEFTMEEPTDPAPRLAINLGKPDDVDAIEAHKVYLDNITLECTDDSGMVESESENLAKDININQVGYLPDDKKTAIFRGDATDSSFDVVNVETGEVAYSGEITGSVENATADETNRYGDFSELTTAGTYKITTDSLGESFEFVIADNVYDDAFAAVTKMLYLQRCGTTLTQEFAGDFAHVACHIENATIYGTSTKIDVSGGWHDAGDYGRYVVPGAKAVADLILAYEQSPSAFTDDMNTSDSSNDIPDILDEAKYELDWMLKMQDSASGGVYHKVTGANFPGMVMPEEETAEMIVSPISDAATADFAAVMAMSSVVFKEYDSDYAATCLAAAKKAWGYIDAKSTLTGFTNPSDIVTGEYPDTNIDDEVFWAAAELYKATGDSTYHDYIEQNYSSDLRGLGWADVGSYGVYAYLSTDETKVDSALYDSMEADMLSYADELLAVAQADGYMISLTKYPWGSNMSVANNAMLLILANELSPKEEYAQYASEHLNYIFGANPMSYCYVTGFGTLSPEHTHHRPSEAIGSTMPGMLVGGPNEDLQDPYAQAVLANEPPAKCYADNSQSYSCNEITIYWNSPLVFVMSSVNE